MEIQAKTKEKPEPVTVNYDVPADLPGMTAAFGEPVVAKAAQGAIVISLQAFMRRLIEKGKSAAEIQEEVSKWKPDVRTVVKQTAFQKVTSSLNDLSAEERKELLARLQAQ